MECNALKIYCFELDSFQEPKPLPHLYVNSSLS